MRCHALDDAGQGRGKGEGGAPHAPPFLHRVLSPFSIV